MKLYQIILWVIVGLTTYYVLIRPIIFKDPFVFEELFTSVWFMACGIVAGWYLKPKQ